jgi:hypothetical protein
MALLDFWTNVRRGASFIEPQFIAEAPKLDPDAIARSLRSATTWLTPRSVAGFNAADFDFLSDPDRARLTQLVTEFRQIASGVKPVAPPGSDQVERAVPLFRDIVGMLEFDRYDVAEAYRLGKQIEREIESYRPDELAELRFKTGPDHSGDPAIWIWSYLTGAAEESDEQFLEYAEQLSGILDPVAREIAPDRIPYLRFRSLAEQAEPLEAP